MLALYTLMGPVYTCRWIKYVAGVTELNSAHMLFEQQPENNILLLSGADITEMVADSEDMLIATSTDSWFDVENNT